MSDNKNHNLKITASYDIEYCNSTATVISYFNKLTLKYLEFRKERTSINMWTSGPHW